MIFFHMEAKVVGSIGQMGLLAIPLPKHCTPIYLFIPWRLHVPEIFICLYSPGFREKGKTELLLPLELNWLSRNMSLVLPFLGRVQRGLNIYSGEAKDEEKREREQERSIYI